MYSDSLAPGTGPRGGANGMVERSIRELKRQLAIVDAQDVLSVLATRKRNVEVELEASRTQQRSVERLDEVGGSHHEHQLVFAEAIHLGEQLVHHGVLDPGAGEGATRRSKRVELVEDDERGRAAPRLHEDLPQVLLALAHPLALQLGPTHDDDGGTERRRHGFGEERLARAWRPQKIMPRGMSDSMRAMSAGSASSLNASTSMTSRWRRSFTDL